jgi:uncharacterized protein (UPF0218 family)
MMAWPLGIAISREAPESIIRVRSEYENSFLITVGDVVTMNVIKYWKVPNLAFMDLKTRRTIGMGMEVTGFDKVINIVNKPATLSVDIINTVRGAIMDALSGSRILIQVDGEEDLLAIPAVLLAPRGSLVLYGLYTGYLIAIPVIDEYKLAMFKLFSMMKSSDA